MPAVQQTPTGVSNQAASEGNPRPESTPEDKARWKEERLQRGLKLLQENNIETAGLTPSQINNRVRKLHRKLRIQQPLSKAALKQLPPANKQDSPTHK